MASAPLLYLSAEDVVQALPMPEAIDAMRGAFAALSNGYVTLPLRANLPAADQQNCELVMPCYCSAAGLFSLKAVTVFPANPSRGMPTIQGLVVLSDGQTGAHRAVMDGTSLTAIRTGAASGLATDLMTLPEARSAAIFGAGVQARTQLEAVCAVRAIERALVYDPDQDAAGRFADEMSQRLDMPVQIADSPDGCLQEADVICTATSSTSPVLPDRALPPGVHVNAVGAFRPDMGEIPPVVVQQARVVVDHYASALDEAGDLLQTLQLGLIDKAHVSTELGDVLLQKEPGRSAPDQVTLFKSVGIAVQDLYAAARALDNARQLGLGTHLA